MYKHLKRFFLFLLPIVRKAAVQVLADELTRVAYPDRPRRRYTPYYDRRPSIRNRGRVVDSPNWHRAQMGLPEPVFHDVLLVAFDLRGPNAQATHEWLHENLPSPGTGGDNDEINLDSWWVANDERFDGSDTDSAVFVPIGHQEEARVLLNEHGLLRF